jgi:hypothetical protein
LKSSISNFGPRKLRNSKFNPFQEQEEEEEEEEEEEGCNNLPVIQYGLGK